MNCDRGFSCCDMDDNGLVSGHGSCGIRSRYDRLFVGLSDDTCLCGGDDIFAAQSRYG